MTTALCLSCGETKFGALCPCANCQVESTGDSELDIAFSDHRMAISTLEELGNVIKEINLVIDDPQIRFWSFIKYVSDNTPEILAVEMDADRITELEEVLKKANLPKVEWQPSPRNDPDRPKPGCLLSALATLFAGGLIFLVWLSG